MLRDETYCQVMKQMTNNPAVSSRARGTILLTLMVGSYLPSGKLMPTVRKFIADGPSGYVSYSNMLLGRTLHNGARFEPPCCFELSSAKRKQIMRLPVKTDCITKSMTQARLDPVSVLTATPRSTLIVPQRTHHNTRSIMTVTQMRGSGSGSGSGLSVSCFVSCDGWH